MGAFQEIKKSPKGFRNQQRADELLEEGGMALQRQDLDSLKSIMIELWSLMPAEKQDTIGNKFYLQVQLGCGINCPYYALH